MPQKTTIPFGPQHPVLPEPIQLNLTLEDANVKRLLPALGYVHRGIEKACEMQDFNQNVFLVERVCGICSSVHALAYCLAVEKLMGLEPPKRAEYLRVIWAELHRIHSHLLWLGLLAEAFGFESVYMQLWRIRELVMDVLEKTAGNRVIISVSMVGGVRRDLSHEDQQLILRTIDDVEKQVDKMLPTLVNDYGIKQRTVGKGAVQGNVALELGAVGPVLRASGVAQDARMSGYCVYDELEFEPVVEQSGDTYARAMVRARELYQSFNLIRRAIKQMPEGELAVKQRGRPNGMAIARAEAPRGEVMYLVAGNNTKFLERVRIRVPTFANVPMMLAMLEGCEFTDVPVIALSIDPCISCTER